MAYSRKEKISYYKGLRKGKAIANRRKFRNRKRFR